jgi:hypothetical protein
LQKVFDPVSIPNKNNLSRRVKQHLYIKLMKQIKFHKVFDPMSIPNKNDLSGRVKQHL